MYIQFRVHRPSRPVSPQPNPLLDSSPASPESQTPGSLPLDQVSPPPAENPAWSGWDVLRIAVLTILSIFFFLFVITYAAHRLVYPKEPWVEVVRYPGLIVLAQLLAYIVVFAFMYVLVERERGGHFRQAIRWNWPNDWAMYLFGGMVLAIGLQIFAHFLPMPKNLPIDQFFQTEQEAYLLSVFGMTFAPLLEELLFRGFLYPVLARRLGMVASTLLTSLAFGLIHGSQLMYAWGPVLIIFLVGLVLTMVRAVTKSVAASLLIHVAYNGTISLAMFYVTGGFRHLERLNQ